MKKTSDFIENKVSDSSGDASSLETKTEERKIIAQIQQLWPTARKSAKALGEQLFKLRELCKESGNRFDQLCSSLSIPRSSAYHFIGIFEECQLVDFEFPTNIVRFAATAGIELGDLNQRKILLAAFQEAGNPSEPGDAQAIGVVGSASTAIREAGEEANQQNKPAASLTPFQQMLAAFTTAQVETYKALVGNKKQIKAMGETTKAAKEAKYVEAVAAMYHLDATSTIVRQRILSIGREEQTLQDMYDEWSQMPVVHVFTREKADIYRGTTEAQLVADAVGSDESKTTGFTKGEKK